MPDAKTNTTSPLEPIAAGSITDGKAAKLRASCDACNESKVRCSQAKPTCARCEKQGEFCVYGLSRRSHKTAPRIGASNATASPIGISNTSRSRNSTSASNSSSTSTSKSASNSNPSVLASSSSSSTANSISENREQTACGDIDFDMNHGRGDNTMLSSIDVLQDFNSYLQQPNGYSNDKPTPDYDFMDFGIMGSLEAPFDVAMSSSAMSPEFLNHSRSLSAPILDTPNPRSLSDRGCGCTSEVTNELLSIPLSFQDDNASFDVQLSQLKRAIKLSEKSIRCECTSWDEMTTMTISILVGRIVQGFETTLLKALPLPENAAKNSPSDRTPNLASPKLSWGVLQIESDDEDNLKQHLWLLHFRKLEALLRQFSASIRVMRNMQGAGNSAHVMACECIHMWLEQKAQNVRDRFLAQEVAASSARV